jgi:phage shock protein C
MVRLATVALFLFTGSLAFWGYIAGIVLLSARREASAEGAVSMEYDEWEQRYRPRKAFHYTSAPTERLQRARERLDAALNKVESMERYVTSRRYDLNQKFSQL